MNDGQRQNFHTQIESLGSMDDVDAFLKEVDKDFVLKLMLTLIAPIGYARAKHAKNERLIKFWGHFLSEEQKIGEKKTTT